jgi:hypothetical protein
MIGLDSSTCVTLEHILHYLSFHSCLPKVFLQILIHVVGFRLDRIPRAMDLVHDLAVMLKVLQNHEAVLES